MSFPNFFPNFITNQSFENMSILDLKEYRKTLLASIEVESIKIYRTGFYKWQALPMFGMANEEELHFIGKKYCSEAWSIINQIDFMLDDDIKSDSIESLEEEGLNHFFEGAESHGHSCECPLCSKYSSIEDIDIIGRDINKMYVLSIYSYLHNYKHLFERVIELSDTDSLDNLESVVKSKYGEDSLLVSTVPFTSLRSEKQQQLAEDIEIIIL